MKTERKKRKSKLEQELFQSMKKGAALYLDGKLSSPEKISLAVLREDHFYMADYVTDDRGCIKEIRYDNISCSR